MGSCHLALPKPFASLRLWPPIVFSRKCAIIASRWCQPPAPGRSADACDVILKRMDKLSRYQRGLFGTTVFSPSLPTDYDPVRPAYFEVARIYLARGSIATAERKRFVERICGLYPEAPVEVRLDTPHNRLQLGGRDPLGLHRAGKRTLVFGELESAVRFSEEKGNACPNYWHFSPYGFCPYGCRYCYLAGTPGAPAGLAQTSRRVPANTCQASADFAVRLRMMYIRSPNR
jgi:hypothetical protein